VDGSDNPGWIADTTANTLTRYGQDLGGDLSAEITTTGVTTASPTTTAKVTLIDPHGDLAATATIPASGNAAGIDSWSDTTEYGLPRAGTTTPTDPGRYNWLGGKQRATDTTGLLLMGARLYNPTTGQFTSTDPVPAGNDTAYSYPSDPINIFDLDGRIATSDVWQVLAEAGVCMSVGITGCAKIIAISIRALRVTRRLLPREKNAVRHFIWQGAMTYYVGFAAAAAVGASHEVGEAVGISSDSSKDKYNNRVGRRWATVHDTQLKWKNFFGGMSSVVAYLKRAGRILYRQRKLKR